MLVSAAVCVCSWLLPHAMAEQSMRVAVPDLAGMLYPALSQQVVVFGTAWSTMLFAPNSSINASSGCTHALCLDLVLSSQFADDPFLLAQYDSRYPSLQSSTFNGLDADSIQPIVLFSSNASSISNSSSSGSNESTTLWTFYTDGDQGESIVPMVDMLLRLKQQSQWRARNEQLFIHINASLDDAFKAMTTVDAYSVYGSQQVDYSTTRVATNHLRFDLSLIENANASRVTPADAYPLVFSLNNSQAAETPARWAYAQSECTVCVARLYGCAIEEINQGTCGYDSTQDPFIACLRDDAELNEDWFLYHVSQSIGSTTAIQTLLDPCFNTLVNGMRSESISGLAWWNATFALTCLAANSCPFGPFDGVLQSNATAMITLASTISYSHTIMIANATFSGSLSLSFGNKNDSIQTIDFSDQTSATEIKNAIDLVFEGLNMIVAVTKELVLQEWLVIITYADLVGPVLVSTFQSDDSMTSVQENYINTGSVNLTVTAMDSQALTRVDQCESCSTKLAICQQDEICRRQVLPCVIERMENIAQSQVTNNATMATNRVDLLPLLGDCVDDVPAGTWDAIRLTLVCMADTGCALGPVNATTHERTTISMETGTQVFALPATEDDDVELNFTTSWSSSDWSNTSQAFAFNGSVSTLADFIAGFVLENGGSVTQTTSVYSADSSWLVIRLEYEDLLHSMPSITALQMDWIEDELPVKAYFEYDDANLYPTLDALLTSMRSYTIPPAPDGPAPEMAWVLAPECLDCSAQLFGCLPDQVASGACYYNSAMTPLGLCLRDQLPPSTYQALLNTSINSSDETTSSMTISSDVAYCMQQVASAAENDSALVVLASTVNSQLSCFVRTQCPFGPVDLIQDSQVVQLDVTSYIQILRVHARAFQLSFEFQLGVHQIASASFSDATTAMELAWLLSSALQFTGINASVPTFSREAGGAEWTLEIRYLNVMVPDFSVSIDSDSIPAPATAIQQMILRSNPRLIVSPRRADKVAHIKVNASSESNTTSTDCAYCEITYLSACATSKFCQNTMLPCVWEALDTNNSSNMTTYDGQIDVTHMLRVCSSASTDVFYDWWRDLHDFFACYGHAQCAVSNNSSNTTQIIMERGIQQIAASNNPTQLELPIWPFAGGGLYSTARDYYEFSGNSTELEQVLMYMTQDLDADVTVQATALNGSRVNLTIDFGEGYVGEMPAIQGSDVSVHNFNEPRLLFSSADTSIQLDWSGLRSTLGNANMQSFTGKTCSECSPAFSTACGNSDECRLYLLRCLIGSANEGFESVYSTDLDLMPVLQNCTDDLSLRGWWALQDFLACFERAQCAVGNNFATGSHSYMRLQRAREQILVAPSMMSNISVDIVPPKGSSISSTQHYDGPISGLAAMLEYAIDSVASVVYHQRTSANASMVSVDLIYDHYYGATPTLMNASYTTTGRKAPRLFLFDANGGAASPRILASVFVANSGAPTCDDDCATHLDECQAGNTTASLVCREVLLPCVMQVLTTLAAEDQIMSQPIEILSLLLSECRASMPTAWEPIMDFIACYEATKCLFNEPLSSVAPTRVDILNGSELLLVPSNMTTLAVSHESTAFWSDNESIIALGTGETEALRMLLQDTVLQSAVNVQVVRSSASTDLDLLTVNYSGLMGELPVIYGNNVVSLKRINPQILMTSDITTRPKRWDRFESNFEGRYESIAQRSCGSCATQTLSDCAICQTEIAPCLMPYIAQDNSQNGTQANLTSAVQACTQDLLASDWQALVLFVSCYVKNSCPVSNTSTNDLNATYFILTEASQTFTIRSNNGSNASELFITQFPRSFGFDLANDYPIDSETDFSGLVNPALATVNSIAQITTVDSLNASTGEKFEQWSIRYPSYYGALPIITGDYVVSASTAPAQFLLQSLGGNASWDLLAAELEAFIASLVPTSSTASSLSSSDSRSGAGGVGGSDSSLNGNAGSIGGSDSSTSGNAGSIGSTSSDVVTSTSSDTSSSSTVPDRVLASTCAGCGSQLFLCNNSEVSSGSCNYTASQNAFVQCMADTVQTNVFQTTANSALGSSWSFTSYIAHCFTEILSVDEAANADSFTDDLWYRTSEGMACFDAFNCPFGPLSASIGSDAMAVVKETQVWTSFTIGASTFTGHFTAKYGFRTLESDSISQSMASDDIEVALIAVMPASVDLSVDIIPSVDGSTWTMDVNHTYIYYPDMELSLVLDQSDTSVTKTINEDWSAALTAMALDTTTFQTLT